MKDYLKEELTQEERLIIIGVIWKISRKFKMLYYKEKDIVNLMIQFVYL